MEDIINHVDEMDDAMSPFLDREIKSLDPIEHALLWLGIYELSHRKDIPYRVVINEAVEVSKQFGAEESHKYINGILDKLVPQLRPGE